MCLQKHMPTFKKFNILRAYVLRKWCKDPLHIRIYKHKTLDDVSPYIRRWRHRNGFDKDLDTFLECMQDALGIQDLLYIQVSVLKW